MYSLVDLGLITIFTIALTASYFGYEKLISIKALSFLRLRKYVLDTLAGVFIGLFTILFKVILERFDANFGIPIFFIVGIVFLISRGVNTSAPAFIIPLIYNMFDDDFASINYYIVSFFALISIIWVTTTFYLEIKWANLSVVIAIAIMAIIALPVIGSAFDYGYGRITFEHSLLLSLATAIVYYPFRTAIRFSISANLLFESVNFVYSRYYRPSLTQRAIGSYISEHKVSKGVFGLFELKIDARDQNDKSEVLETILNKVEKFFDTKTTLFSHDANIYGFFIPFKQDIKLQEIIKGNTNNHYNDLLIDLEDLVSEVDGSYETTTNNVVPVEIRIGTSIYGIQSNSIFNLEKTSLIALRGIDWASHDKVRNFSFVAHKEKIKDASRLALMDKNIDLNNFSNRYIPLFAPDGKYANMQYVSVENTSEYELVENVDELVRINRWKTTFDRYFASEAISKNKDSNAILLLQYSYIFSDTFKIEKFIRRLNRVQFNKSKMVIILSWEELKLKKTKVLEQLKENEIKFAIMDFPDYKSVAKFNPNFLILKRSQILGEIKTDIPTIAPFISNENDFKMAVEKNVHFVGGSLLEINSNVKKPNKQSKIYIEDILSNIKEGN